MKTWNQWTLAAVLAVFGMVIAFPACDTGNGGGKDRTTLSGITLDTASVEKAYLINENLDLSGLTVSAVYSDGTTTAVTNYTTSPANGTALTTVGDVTITISYTEGDITKTAAFTVSVSAIPLTGITLNTASVKEAYLINENLDLSGLTVSAVYSDSTTAAVTNYTAIPANGTALTTYGKETITVSYTEEGITKTAEFTVNVTPTSGEIVGTGTSTDPFLVYDVATLSSVGKTPSGYEGWTLSAHYKQVANIDLAEIDNWTQIGDYYIATTNQFTGTYDGGGYTIANLTINATRAYQGLFGYVGADGIVKNVGLIDCDIINPTSSTGGVAGQNHGTVSNCYVTGNVSSGNSESTGSNNFGGIVGWNTGSVSNCYTTGNVSSSGSLIGGVIGINVSGGTVENCVALNSSITRTFNTSTYFGRVVGFNITSTFTNNYARSNMVFIDEEGNSSTTFPYNETYPPDNGTDITSTQWSNPAWWTETAGWDASIWDFSGISATSYPKLR